jgi:hypothetical protein
VAAACADPGNGLYTRRASVVDGRDIPMDM